MDMVQISTKTKGERRMVQYSRIHTKKSNHKEDQNKGRDPTPFVEDDPLKEPEFRKRQYRPTRLR